MTLNEAIKYFYNNAVDGYFNGEKFSYNRFTTYIKKMFSTGADDVYVQIAMPDGWWLSRIYKVPYGKNMYDYYIPENRKEERILWSNLLVKS